MKLGGFLGKPRWQAKDAATRRDAVAHDDDPDLRANLGRFAREDPDAGVRIAALKRGADPGIAQGLAHDDADADVRAQARALWLDLLTGTHPAAPSLVERSRLLMAQDDGELIERVVRGAREPELRRLALGRVTRPALLQERALEDPDAAIRLALVERIDDEAQLARLAERARKSDKNVSRRARERAEALRIGRGDSTTLEQRARSLCEQLEQLLRDPRDDDAEARIDQHWNGIAAAVPATLCARYAAARALLASSRTPPAPRQEALRWEPVPPMPAAVAEIPDAAPAGTEAEPAAAPAADAVVAPLLARARFAASLDEANAAMRQRQDRQCVLLDELEQSIAGFEAAIDSGASARAHAAKARIDVLRRDSGSPLPGALAQRLARAEKRHAELSRWQHWADNQRRRQLCVDIEVLAGAALHPDAVAVRVREAQNEWSRLDLAEGRDMAQPSPLARRFHAACRASLAPAQAYFRKRQELRQSHTQQVRALLERAAAPLDGGAAVALKRDILDALHGLDRIEPRERNALARRLKTCLASLDSVVAQRDAQVEAAKAALIAQAAALGRDGVQRGAVTAARDLQHRWQQAGNGRRARDQSQWKSFRAAIDAVFAGLDAERNERVARDAEARDSAQALCAEFEALAAQPEAERGAVSRLQSAWEALHVRDEPLLRRFAHAQSQLREAGQRRERSRRVARYAAWLARYRLCRSAERGDDAPAILRERWCEAPPTDIGAQDLERRFQAAGPGPLAASADARPFREILLALEMLAGIESPAGDREQRRQVQVARLAARMRGDARVRASDELADLLARWTVLGAVPDAELDARLERGLAAALETLP